MIRRATINDLKYILDIYNFYVMNSVSSFDTSIRTVEGGEKWFNEHDDKYPIIVYEDNDIEGWASLSKWASHDGYIGTVELSIYVKHDSKGKQIGKKLFESIIKKAKELNYHCIISRITEGNEVSRKMHENYGFTYIGVMKEVGKKFDKYLDVHLYQYIIE
ncbi:L-methionine sulfoximine/L-methionine sulfone acetyltransferase [Gottschalkia purinilytica]|uniref:L-methionine sulfoximine/L-methionine sulfone acetyltransferase n=1 Tax=Gottschalkia purinilytica TaxID=1503 RepID=A0A0L0W6V8_GOTPU|nr:GNAT family N-acetyltransferase [Gottschalkia purinilytica]KNF07216.1 L-methionine sulfoximine/L-methionine sulfone acetyltransferase [Gottschalkia purinilytica]